MIPNYFTNAGGPGLITGLGTGPPGAIRPTHMVKVGVTGGSTDVEAAPQVATGPLAVAEGTLLPVRLPG